MHFSTIFNSAVLLAGTVVQALPNPHPVLGLEGGYDENVIVSRFPLPKDFMKHALQAITTKGPAKTKTMMHSGIGAEKAAKVARTKKLQTVETTIMLAIMDDVKSKKNVYKDTLQKYCIKKDDFCDIKGGNLEDWKAAWAGISETWANYADKETTLATVQAGPAKDSFYKVNEEPILEKKKVKITVDKTFG